jgi:protein transport protein SEC31
VQIYIWNLQDPSRPYSPGSRSTKLDEITALRWNQQVPHVLASASSTGYTVVWDLRNKREVVSLAYGGAPAGGPAGSMAGRRGMSDIAWQPDNVRAAACRSRRALIGATGNASCHLFRG